MKITEVCSEARGNALFTILGLELKPGATRGGRGVPDTIKNDPRCIRKLQHKHFHLPKSVWVELACIYTSNRLPWQRMQMCMQRFAVFVRWCGVPFPLKLVNCQKWDDISRPRPRQDLCRNISKSLTLKANCTVETRWRVAWLTVTCQHIGWNVDTGDTTDPIINVCFEWSSRTANCRLAKC